MKDLKYFLPFLGLSIIVLSMIYFLRLKSPEDIAYISKKRQIEIRNLELTILEKLYDISSDLNYKAERAKIDSILKAELGKEYDRLLPLSE